MKKAIKHKVFIGIFVVGFLSMASAVVFISPTPVKADNTLPKVTVYKTATCGCCKKWVKHLKNKGFVVEPKNLNSLSSIKEELGIKPKYRSCHTAKVGKYFVEGHVPAEDIKKMLTDSAEIKGLAVPGMPMGSPGMEGSRKDAYDVLAISNDGSQNVYNSH